jgi:hypothetical protein
MFSGIGRQLTKQIPFKVVAGFRKPILLGSNDTDQVGLPYHSSFVLNFQDRLFISNKQVCLLLTINFLSENQRIPESRSSGLIIQNN